MQRIIFLFFVLAVLVLGLSCGGTATGGSSGDSPTEAYKRLFAAVKSKNVDAIKTEMSAKSLDLAKMASAKNNTPIEKVYENGFTATTFSPALPEIRDERVVGDKGAVEVWNSKDSRWEDLPFVKENGVWKFAVGDLFAGTFKIEDVGRGRAYREGEAANAAGKGPAAPASNTMANVNTSSAPAIANSNAAPVPPTRNSSDKTK